MKFTVKSAVQIPTGSLTRSFNTLQVPEVGIEYETTTNGRVIDMYAYVTCEDGQWYWIPIDSSCSSYSFVPERFLITF